MHYIIKLSVTLFGALSLMAQAMTNDFAPNDPPSQNTTNAQNFELIFLLNDEYYGIDFVEDAIAAINNKDAQNNSSEFAAKRAQLIQDLGSPKSLDYLIPNNRLSKEVLSTLPHDDPERLLNQFVIASYDIPQDIDKIFEQAKNRLSVIKNENQEFVSSDITFRNVEKNKQFELSSVPNDPYYRAAISFGPSASYQSYFDNLMRIEQGWRYSSGRARLGMIDTGIQENHKEFVKTSNKHNYMKRYSLSIKRFANERKYGTADESNYYEDGKGHGTHVAGIMAAATNNNKGGVGVCQECTLTAVSVQLDYRSNAIAIKHLIDMGVVAINLSFGGMHSCDDNIYGMSLQCTAIQLAKKNNVLIVAASGNGHENDSGKKDRRVDNMQFPASHPDVISVGAMDWSGNLMDIGSTGFFSQMGSPSNPVDVVAYGVKVFSTFYEGSNWSLVDYPAENHDCADRSLINGRELKGYGYCTGTSMAAPFVTAIVGLMRSANPYLTNAQIKALLTSPTTTLSRTDTIQGQQFTYKIPQTDRILSRILGAKKNKKVPLITMYSSQQRNHFYTTSPQNAAAASYTVSNGQFSPYVLTGNMAPSDEFSIYGYQSRSYPTRAQGYVYVHTTHNNPVATTFRCPMTPLYRMNYWRSSRDADHVLATDMRELNYFAARRYKYEGIEGYVFPKTCAQPAGTVKLMRKYNPWLRDHAVFPETMYRAMYSRGYRYNSGSDWLGYVYPM